MARDAMVHEELTRILRDPGDRREKALPLVYEELRSLAERRMGAERAGHTLQATALVHEAYLRMLGTEKMDWASRGHFYAAAAEAMRRILVDHARKVKSLKRGGDRERVTLGAPEARVDMPAEELLALDDALTTLEAEDERAARVARLRFLSGLSVEDITPGFVEERMRLVSTVRLRNIRVETP